MQKILNYFCQRTTWAGLCLIYLACAGLYFNLLDEASAVFLLIFACPLLISERHPLAQKIFCACAPVLVHQIKSKPNNAAQKPLNFEEIFKNSALAGPSPKESQTKILPRKRIDRMTEEMTALAAENDHEKTVTGDMIADEIKQIIHNAAADKIPAETEAAIDKGLEVAGKAIDLLLPLAIKNQIAANDFLVGVSEIGQGVLLQESGLKKISDAVKSAKAA